MSAAKPFWQTKSLNELSRREWESLCDGCGRCCLNKFENQETGKIYYTDVACKLLDHETCRCASYRNRTKYVQDCLVLTPEIMPKMSCLPKTCAYRLVYEGRDLYPWHPLISGNPESVHDAGISVRGRIVSEIGMSDDDMEDRLVKWPMSCKVRHRDSNQQTSPHKPRGRSKRK